MGLSLILRPLTMSLTTLSSLSFAERWLKLWLSHTQESLMLMEDTSEKLPLLFLRLLLPPRLPRLPPLMPPRLPPPLMPPRLPLMPPRLMLLRLPLPLPLPSRLSGRLTSSSNPIYSPPRSITRPPLLLPPTQMPWLPLTPSPVLLTVPWPKLTLLLLISLRLLSNLALPLPPVEKNSLPFLVPLMLEVTSTAVSLRLLLLECLPIPLPPRLMPLPPRPPLMPLPPRPPLMPLPPRLMPLPPPPLPPPPLPLQPSLRSPIFSLLLPLLSSTSREPRPRREPFPSASSSLV